jgi:hypothetical protein
MNICKMNRIALACATSASMGLAMAGSGDGDSTDSSLIRSTEFGQVEGVRNTNDNSVAWLGIPFAKPPVG